MMDSYIRIFVRILSEPQKLPDTPLRFGTAICMNGLEFQKETAYNAFFAVIIHLAILCLLACFKAYIPLSTFRMGW